MSLPSTKPSLSSTQSPEQMNAFPFVKGECCNCGVKDRWLLHNVVVRGVDRRICTSCVLRLHPSSFCPCCFEFYENPYSLTSATSAHRFISCVKCSSLSHIQCLSSSPPPSPFLCPPCSQPKFTFFPVPELPVDEKLAKIFLCACKIASASMKKQAAASTVRSDRAVKESAIARKKAKEALEHCFTIRRLKDAYDLANNNVVCKKEDVNGFGGGQGQGQPQSQNVALNNKIGSNGSSVVVNKVGANGNDGRIGNNGGRFGGGLKTSVL